MHVELADSLEYLAAQASGGIAFDAERFRQLIASLRAGKRYPPVLFGLYYQLAFDLLEGPTEAAAKWFAELCAVAPAAQDLVVTALDPPQASKVAELYDRLMSGEAQTDVAIRPPSAEVAQRFRARFSRALDLIDRALPELAAEFRGIVREVVCVVGAPERTVQFDGGSHFQLWGALFLNASFHPTDEAMVEVIAHESAHSLLFGFCTAQPLVYNPDSELYPSPLRLDPRPMDGIYHATFVSARMHLAMAGLLASGLLTATAAERARGAMDADRRNFLDGDAVVRAHADLSPLGRELMAGARDYMAGATA
jgi:HEXXH motif-containing protein